MKLFLSLLGISAGVYLVALIGLVLFQNKFTFQTVKMKADKSFAFDAMHREVFLDDPAGEAQIHGLFFPADGPSLGLVLYFHGNSGNLQRWGKYATDFTRLQYDFFAVDYPGYGKSGGKPSEESFYRCAESAYKWAAGKYPENKIVLYGRSIGSAPASYLAAQFPARQLILETPFHSFGDLSRRNIFLKLFPVPPRQQFPVNEFLSQAGCAKALFHGTKDRVVPMASALRLKPLIEKPDNFIVIPGGKHRNLSEFPQYHNELQRLLTSVP